MKCSRFIGVTVALLATGCTSWQLGRADRAATATLEGWTEKTVGDRRETVRFPETRAPATATEEPPGPDGPGFDASTEPLRAEPEHLLGLRDALEIAYRTNRDYLQQRESLYSTAIGLVTAGHAFTPQMSLALGYTFASGDLLTDESMTDVPHDQTVLLDGSVSQILPFGGDVTASGSTSRFRTDSPFVLENRTYTSSLGVRLTQPLLRGAGLEVTWEPLVQAERDLMYAIRDFERFREGFSIDVARRFYELVQQKESIENQRQNLEGFVFGRRQADALFSVGRKNELDVLRARRSELTSRNDLLEAEEGYRLALDQFKIFLGLAVSASIDVQPEAPEFVPVEYDADSAIEVALHNRLDLMNEIGRLEDVERGVRITENALLPDLDVTLAYDVDAGPGARFRDQGTNSDSYSAGITLALPIDRVNERNALRQAMLGLDQARRSLQEFKDSLVVELRGAFRELERRKLSLEIQRQLIVDQEKNAKIAQLQFERGDLSNRDVVEAQQALLDARNSLINERVNYEIARLQLMQNLGILFIDDRGMWQE